MDPSHVDQVLEKIRTQGDCQLQDSPFIGRAFISIPPHRVGIAHLVLRPRFLLADPVGTGKTPQALIAYGLLKAKARTNLRLLVLAPKAALFQWQDSIEKFLPGVTAEVLGYDDRRRATGPGGRHSRWADSSADVLITTYTTAARDIELLLPALDNFVAIFDEVQALKSRQQKLLYPAALKLSHKARCVWGLSATPNPNRLQELHAVMEVIRPGLLGSERSFNERYINRVWVKLGKARNPKRPWLQKGFWYFKGYKNLPELMARIRPYYLRRPAAEINQYLPPVVFQQVRLSMTEAQQDIYQQIVAKHLPDPYEGEGKALTHLTALGYAQQACDAPEVLGYEGVGSSKMDELARFLTEDVSDEKVIIYARYERVVSYICAQLAALKIETVRITGKESAAQRDLAKRRFNLEGGKTIESSDAHEVDLNKLQFDTQPTKTLSPVNVIVLDSAGGQALDLQAAGIVVFFDLPWSYGEFTQVVGRARRTGSTHSKILAVMLANEGTIDDKTLGILQFKEGLVGETFGLEDGSIVSAPPGPVVKTLYEAVRGSGHDAGVASTRGRRARRSTGPAYPTQNT